MNNVWIIGAGEMAQNYYKVLKDLNIPVTVIGRGEKSAIEFEKLTGKNVETGGLQNFLSKKYDPCSHAIVAVGVEKLFETTKQLLNHNINNILVEKPGALFDSEFKELVELSKAKKANVYIAYNRRFFASVLEAKKIIEQDGGVTSFNFEFTEWAHTIEPLQKGYGVKEKWFLSNSTHVVDLAFILCGFPKEISCFTNGSLKWHPSSSIFCGSGISEKGALFNYTANWESAGRWGIEILTKNHKLILRPMEKLKIQKKGSITEENVESIDYKLDNDFKPGLYLQTLKFLNHDFNDLCSIEEQYMALSIYNKIANYK